jgi:hypothetical protein
MYLISHIRNCSQLIMYANTHIRRDMPMHLYEINMNSRMRVFDTGKKHVFQDICNVHSRIASKNVHTVHANLYH